MKIETIEDLKKVLEMAKELGLYQLSLTTQNNVTVTAQFTFEMQPLEEADVEQYG